MDKRQIKTLKNEPIDLDQFFAQPPSKRQRQYEAVRAIVVEKLAAEVVAQKFEYQVNTVYSLVKNAKTGKLALFPEVLKSPQERQTPPAIQAKIVQYRHQGLAAAEIQQQLTAAGESLSLRTVERILKDAGFKKFKRRSLAQLGRTTKNKLIAARSQRLDFTTLSPFRVDCPVAGVFFFLPYIIESGLVDIIEESDLPTSSEIDSVSACLSILLLKLIGNKRLSQMDAYDHEPGLAVFAGLNVLPKATYMSRYSCLTSETMLLDFQEVMVTQLKKSFPTMYTPDFINLDFHSIPHYGTESEMEKIWCGAKGKTLKGATTIFAQNSKSASIIYTRADILRQEEAQEIKKFIAFWKVVNGQVNETLVFDCKFTKYAVLDELATMGIKFITLRKRSQKLIQDTEKIAAEKWERVQLQIPKRKYQEVSVTESSVMLKDCHHPVRQIIVKDHGRAQPTFIITNDSELSLQTVLEVYAKRWRIENKLAELVTFFNLNALSSPVMIRVHFDVLWTMLADTFYHRFALDLRRFEKHLAPSIFKKFINMPGKLIYDGEQFYVKIRKRAYTPILKSVAKLTSVFRVPWLNNKLVKIEWTP